MYEEESDSWKRWGLGLVAPVAVAGFGLIRIVRQEIMLGKTGSQYLLTGPGAVAAGFTFLFAAALMHFYFYYQSANEEPLRQRHFTGSGISGILCVLSLGAFLYFLLQRAVP